MLTPTSSAPTLRVAFYRTSSIGDVVLATACLDLLRQLPVPTEVTWIGRGASLEMLASSYPEIRTLAVRREDTMGDLQRAAESLANVHLFIDLQCNLRSRWLGRQLRSATGTGVFQADKAQLRRSRLLLEARVRGRRRPLPEKARAVPQLQYEMMCDALRRGLRHHLPVEMRDGLESMTIRPRLPIPDTFDSPWRKELRFGAWLGVAPGAAHPTKAAPLELFVETIDKVKEATLQLNGRAPSPLGLVFFGDTHDRQACRQLLDDLSWRGPVLNLAGRLSLWESAVALRETTCLLSNDSSLGHIAEAVDTPTAVLFGPTIESFGFAPRMRQSRAFSSLVGCRPCSKHGRAPCRYSDKLCFTTLSPDEIATHLVSLLMSPDARFRRRQQQAVEALRRATAGTLEGGDAAAP
jgi:ADP-heptose:LPS heptosyltransferase